VALGIIDRSVEFSDNSPTPDVAGLMEGVYA